MSDRIAGYHIVSGLLGAPVAADAADFIAAGVGLFDDGLGWALGEDEGGDEVGDETASSAEDEDYPGQPDYDRVDVKVVGYSYADAQNLAAFLFAVEFLVHN